MAKLSVKDLKLKGQRVLLRVDFNVPLQHGAVANDQRIRAAVPTIEFILQQGGRLILISHLGRPKGQKVPAMSLRPVAPALSELIGRPVAFVDDCLGVAVEAAAADLADGQVLLLENLRFYNEETDNNADFAAKLARLADVYVNDAFGTAHRAHASTEGVTHHMARSAAGLLMKKELDYLGRITQNPLRPFVAVLGGAKISGKIDVISNLLPKVDRLIIGGAMSYTFFKAKGLTIGSSLLEADKVDLARSLLAQGKDKIRLPVDAMISDRFDFASRTIGELKQCAVDAIPAGWTGLDIGPQSVEAFRDQLLSAKTIVWNGPMGVFEIEKTARGTFAVAGILAEATGRGAVSVVGGGDSAAAVEKAGMAERVSHVSTGGGASLEFLEGKVLPGVAALTDK
jgi:phosphoglycerate kinase